MRAFLVAAAVMCFSAAPALEQASREHLDAMRHLRLGQENMHAEQWDKAEAEFRAAIKLEPSLEMAHYGLGQVFAMKNQWSAAEAELKKALQASPDNVGVHYTLARLYQQTGRKDDAQREFGLCNRLNAQRQRGGSGIAGEQP